MEFEFDAPAVGVANVSRPVTTVHAESFARFTVLDLDAGLAQVVEQRRHRLPSIGLVRAQQDTDVLAVDVERLLRRNEVEVSPAGGHGDEREFVALEALAVPDGESEQVVVEFECSVEVADADGDVVEIDRFECHTERESRRDKSPRTGECDPEVHGRRARPHGMASSASERFAPAIDGHTHLMPGRLMGAIRGALAEQAGWTFDHPTGQDGMEAQFREAGVERYIALPYAHKPGMAADLNEWVLDRATDSSMTIPFATVHGDDDVETVVSEAFATGARGLKFQCPVQECGPADPRLDPAFELAAEYDRPILFHAGTAPLYEDSPHVGIEAFTAFTESYPEVRAACAHMGAFETDDFLALAEDHDNAFLDTSFVMSTESEEYVGSAPDVPNERLEALSESVFYGSDYPNIPYPYECERAGLLDRNLSESAFRDLFVHTAERFLGER